MTGLVAFITGLFIVLFIVALVLIGIAALVLVAFVLALPCIWLVQVFTNVKTAETN